MMALDDVVSSTTTGPRVAEATDRTLRWIDRCIAAHKRPHDQNLFGYVSKSGSKDTKDRKFFFIEFNDCLLVLNVYTFAVVLIYIGL